MRNKIWSIVLGIAILASGNVFSARAQDWDVLNWGKLYISDEVIIHESKPRTCSEEKGNGLLAHFKRGRFWLLDKYLLVKQNEANFAYAYAGVVSMDPVFVKELPVQPVRPPRRGRIPDRDIITLPVEPPPPMEIMSKDANSKADANASLFRPVRQTEKPKKAEERLDLAATYWNKVLKSAAGTDTVFKKHKIGKEIVYKGHWKEVLRIEDIVFAEEYLAWIFDNGRNTYMFFIMTDSRQQNWLNDLMYAAEKSKKKK